MKLNKWLRIVLFPPAMVILSAVLPVTGLLILSFVRFESAHPVSIVSYTLSFYLLTVSSLRVPDAFAYIKKFGRENAFLKRLKEDVRFKMRLTLNAAVAFNAVYAFFQLCLGFKHHSVWFYTMAGYYALLCVMRLMLIRGILSAAPGENQAAEWKKYRICGFCLAVITLALQIFIAYFILKIRAFRHHEITTISMAAYTFTALTVAIINAVRYKVYESPVYSAAKAVSLAAAVVSVLTLENAMFTSFGNDTSEIFRKIMLGFTGLAVLLTVIAISAYMVINATRKLKKLKEAQKTENRCVHQKQKS